MSSTANSSSSPRTKGMRRLIDVSLERLRAHPRNANVMPAHLLDKLVENIKREANYPPIIVRPSSIEGHYEILDGHQRASALRLLGEERARCYVWPCDDQTALTLLATLNALHGSDDPLKRAEILSQLREMFSADELAELLPEDASEIERTLGLLHLDLEEALAEFERDSDGSAGLHAITFAVTAEDEKTIEEAVHAMSERVTGKNRRGRALAAIAAEFLREETS